MCVRYSISKNANNEEVTLSATYGYMCFKSEPYWLSNKITNARRNGLVFKELVKLTMKTDSIKTNVIICYFVIYKNNYCIQKFSK